MVLSQITCITSTSTRMCWTVLMRATQVRPNRLCKWFSKECKPNKSFYLQFCCFFYLYIICFPSGRILYMTAVISLTSSRLTFGREGLSFVRMSLWTFPKATTSTSARMTRRRHPIVRLTRRRLSLRRRLLLPEEDCCGQICRQFGLSNIGKEGLFLVQMSVWMKFVGKASSF